MLKNVPIASFPLGTDQLADEASLPKGAARDMLNVDVDNAGSFGSRPGFSLVSAMTDAHSIWGARDGSFGLYVHGTSLKRVVVTGSTPLSATILTGITLAAKMSFFEYADEVFFSNGHELGVVTRTSARLLGMDRPAQLSPTALSAGALAAGKYSLARSYVLPSGEESALGDLAHITLASRGGVAFSQAISAYTVRVYCTPTNGDVLYLVAELPPGLDAFHLLELPLGKVADTQHLRRMPAGSIVRAFNGRVLTVRDDVVWFSEPFRYGLTSPRHNFVRFNSAVSMVEPVLGGVYVGTAEAVYFLAGDGPSNFKQGMVSVNAPVFGASTLVPGTALPKKLADQGAAMCAVWLGRSGYSLGMPNGVVHDVQSSRIALSEIGAGRAVHYLKDGVKQVLSIVESAGSAGHGAAVDSVI